MSSNVKIYKLQDFIKETPTGKVDLEKSLNMVRDLVVAETKHLEHAVILDLRGLVGYLTFDQVAVMVSEFAKHKRMFNNKMAFLVPVDEKRMARAIHAQSCLKAEGFEVEVFVDYEDAIEWLSDIKELELE